MRAEWPGRHHGAPPGALEGSELCVRPLRPALPAQVGEAELPEAVVVASRADWVGAVVGDTVGLTGGRPLRVAAWAPA
ncbi:hypothetical protein ACIGMX_33260 [Streptomyces aquilus]|uniref:hypothetical protein n=1 Tax=Streptomyces aquilus TaxID=2548456 RepID=UPI0037D6999A